jgi:hypothetical protein
MVKEIELKMVPNVAIGPLYIIKITTTKPTPAILKKEWAFHLNSTNYLKL